MREVLELGSVRLTRSGADGGIDVISAEAGAQVKHYAAAVGAPEVQQAKGAAHGSTHVLFFALSSYTKQAKDYAHAAGVALFSYTIYGDVIPTNVLAKNLLDAAPQKTLKRAREKVIRQIARLAESKRRSQAEAEAKERRAEEKVAAAARRAEEEARRQAEPAEERERVLKEAENLESTATNSEAAIIATIRAGDTLSEDVKRAGSMVTGKTASLILAEYASYFRPHKKPLKGGTPRVSAHRIHEILSWATTDRWMDWKGAKVRFLYSPVAAAARELIELHEEISDTERLKTMSAANWATVLCDWELREAQIEALIDDGCIADFEEVPDAENLRLRVIASMGKSSDILRSLPVRWPHGEPREAVWGREVAQAVVWADPLDLSPGETVTSLSSYRDGHAIETDAWGVPCYPLGSRLEEIEYLSLRLRNPQLRPNRLPYPASFDPPLKGINATAGLKGINATAGFAG